MKKIVVDRVVKQFGAKLAVADVSFEVLPGAVFGLLGPNGAGKTTLIRMLLDILRPDSGTILYDGRPLRPADRDCITYLPEERGLYRKERVADVLEYFARLKGLTAGRARERVRLCLERLELGGAARNRVEELSKGNQQKVQIASALVSDPEVIVLDEPFSGLDPINVRLVKELLAAERAAGKTLVLSTHQMNQVEELCDRLLMLNHGTRVLYGAVAEIVEQFSEPAFVLECTPFDPTVPEIERVVSNGRTTKVYPRAGSSGAALLKALIERGVEIERFSKAATPLEDIFVRVARAAAPGVADE